ncbi:cobalt ABC transporter permease [Alisedimentitalea sp. MJ-SS2]|uniref:cobalt ABC transporter permease n=1 Tax=Aliisedimentitalea sp. MJ-SS2 TaxID=3049795 RepID=UPI00290791B6|nr:cobalt ABC transporter permease [Alisedimentitalea sp. MJ-SS2]MDU8927542.1 cobalt ABC transporter permease [Alisedimentitalea sp. MJ-SS2]
MRGLLILVLLALPGQAMAHKVIATVYAAGDMIEGEIGLSNGDLAKRQLVQITGSDGTMLGEVTTDDEGFFTFTPTLAVDHHFIADMGMGHVARVVLPVAELPKGLQPVEASAAPVTKSVAVAPVAAIDPAEFAAVVRDEMRPIRREIAALKETRDLQAILGGIGYIVGLFGLGFYLAARRKLKDHRDG